MFENYREMSVEERAQVKALHKAIRSDREFDRRYVNLAWGFIRGFKYRRIERQHRMQQLADDGYCPENVLGYVRTPEGRFVEHNVADGRKIAEVLAKHLPGFPEFKEEYDRWYTGNRQSRRVYEWLMDRTGAIPAPVREKRPYVAPTSREVA